MNVRFITAAAVILAASLTASYGQAPDETAAKKNTAIKKAHPTRRPTVEEQIQAFRRELDQQASQINSLKTDLADKNAQLNKAQQAAAEAQAAAVDARAAAAKALEAASAQQQAVTDNNAAVATLQSTVTDMKAVDLSLATTVSDETASLKKAVANPSTLYYKGIALTPGGFTAAETIYRTKATGGDIPTAFSGIPYAGADAYSLSEFDGSARQSRLSLLAEGKARWGTLRGYYEADFLGTGITSNNNQSNSYVMRQRIIYAQAQTNNDWTVAAGQLWSLASEQRKGITSTPGDVVTPQTIDPNYVPGFVWTRQFGFRLVKSFKNTAFGVAVENPQLLYTAALAGNTPYAVLGSAGANGGNYNAAISAAAATTYIQNYTNQTVNGVSTWTPVYKTVQANTNIANYSFNKAPDLIVKAAFDPGFGHFEIFGITGFAHETVYPGVTTDRVLFGGQKDITSGLVPSAATTTAGYYSNSITLGGVGGSLRLPVIKDKLTIGAKGLFGPGMGRYGNSTLADVTANAAGNLVPIHNVSSLLTVEASPTSRLAVYLNYGIDYAGRADYSNAAAITASIDNTGRTIYTNAVATTQSIDSKPYFCPTGASGTLGLNPCTKTPSAAQLSAGGTWGAYYITTPAAIGYGSRLTNNSGCGAIATPGYNGSSTGYYPGGGCGAHTRNVQEVTAGYWYDLYKGDRGRLRQGIQYGYAVREGWSGNPTPWTPGTIEYGAKGIDNMFWTSFRYYLP
jgi:hypothetical protein